MFFFKELYVDMHQLTYTCMNYKSQGVYQFLQISHNRIHSLKMINNFS